MKIVIALALLIVTGPLVAQNDEQPIVEQYLVAGRLAEGAAALEGWLRDTPDDSSLHYSLGVVLVLQAVENLAQNLHRYGLRASSPQLPFVRLPVPANPQPEELTYPKWRAVLQQFIDNLSTAEQALARVSDPDVKLKLPVGLVRLDLDGDGEATQEETFWRIFSAVAWRAAKLDEQQQRFEIGFDAADVHWLIGYTHLLRAMAEAWLAHDTEKFFDQTAHLFFTGAPGLPDVLGSQQKQAGFNTDQIADAIAAIHLMRFEPIEPERLARARRHLLSMIDQSRTCWEHAVAETDDDREWIPSADQTSLTPLTVTAEIIEGWRQFLDEAEAVLEGEKLIPHWRVKEPLGINLKKVLEEPQTFDLVLWAHGAAALPYLEEGEVVSRETATTLSRTFQGRFVVFAIWFQ